MIIFDLDGTLADCEHRRHYVDPVSAGLVWWNGEPPHTPGNWTRNGIGVKWKPDWKAFFEACDKDAPIWTTIYLFMNLSETHHIEIWSGRCESVRDETVEWLDNNGVEPFLYDQIKMRPEGDYTPDDELKEKWLKEAIAQGELIEMVFDDRRKVVDMWRRNGIFCFDCNQTGKVF